MKHTFSITHSFLNDDQNESVWAYLLTQSKIGGFKKKTKIPAT